MFSSLLNPLRLMLTSFLSRVRRTRTVLFALMMAIPLMGASECGNLLGVDEEESYDGTYTLVSVNGDDLPYDIYHVDSRNRLVLTQGEWTVSGTTLYTKMWTTSIINGSSQREARFNPEQHTGTITVSDGTATGTLDTGSSVYATIDGGTLVTSYSGHTLYFEKQ